MTLPLIAFVRDHPRASIARPARGLIRRPIVHDEDLGDGAAQAADDRADRGRLVEGGDEGGDAHRAHRSDARIKSAGSTRTDARASAITLTVDTMPIERSGA